MRTRIIKYQWWCFIFLIFIVLSGMMLVGKKNSVTILIPLSSTTELTYSLAPIKHITKSLAELGKMDEINKHLLFFNFIPNSGWEAVVFLLSKLQGKNTFKHVRLLRAETYLTTIQQEKLVDQVYDQMRTHAVPLSFDKQVHFTNFTIFDRQSPTFINIIRDPADKILSRSNNKFRANKRCLHDVNKCDFIKLDLSIPYFCGHDPRCSRVNSEWALITAKNNVEKYYAVVGILEDFTTTLEVFEKRLPNFFKGAKEIYESLDLSKKRLRKFKSDLKFRKILPKEYEFYDWAKSRLRKQLNQKD